MKSYWTRASLLSVRCPIDSVEEERSTKGRCAHAVAKTQRKRLFEYFDYTGTRVGPENPNRLKCLTSAPVVIMLERWDFPYLFTARREDF